MAVDDLPSAILGAPIGGDALFMATQKAGPFCFVTVILLLGFSVAAAAKPIRIATWNLYNLHDVPDEPLRKGAPARSRDDYALLRKYAERLDADVIALQEVNGPAAAALVFPESEYELHFSGRYTEDRKAHRVSDRIYTGFAVRRGVFEKVAKQDYGELSVRTSSGRPTRWGTDLIVEKSGRRLRLLSIHLKSGCFRGSLESPRSDNCATLARQRAPLEQWIDRRASEDAAFVVLGDFNRAFDLHDQKDHVWREIDDGSPRGLNLWRLPFDWESQCWSGSRHHHRHPIDFFVFDERAWRMVDQDSFEQITYAPADRDAARRTPSDHCPIVVELAF